MSDEEFAGIGLALGVVTGVRSFKVDNLGRLTGINYEQVWKPGENLAECRKNEQTIAYYYAGGTINRGSYIIPNAYDALLRSMSGQVYPSQAPVTGRAARKAAAAITVAPDTSRLPKTDTMEDCQHGFYAYYDGSNNYHDQGKVTGVIEGYGEVLIGTRGFRCMKARIVALRLHTNSADALGNVVARNYASIPQFEKFADMIAAFPPDGGEKAITPENDPDFWERSI